MRRGIQYSNSPKGMIALFTAIITVTIMTFAFAEYQYDNIVHLNIAQNAADNLKAKYLAKSGISFNLLMLQIQKKIIDPINKQFRLNFQIWQQMPVSSELFDMFLKGGGGFLSSMIDEDKQETFENMKDKELPKDVEEEKEVSFERNFDFDGSFYTETVDESAKYSVNFFTNRYKTKTIEMNLSALFSQPEYTTFFEEERENEQVIGPDEVIASIKDWVDTDDERSGFYSGAEDDRYSYLKKPYKNKNQAFTSFDELYMIYGIDDDFMEAFGERLTIYGSNEININSCDEMVLKSLIFGIVKDIPPQYMEPYSPDMSLLLSQIIEMRSITPFRTANDFYNLLNSIDGIKVDNVMKRRFKLVTESTIFKIISYGNVGNAVRKITVVVNVNELNNQFIYFREE